MIPFKSSSIILLYNFSTLHNSVDIFLTLCYNYLACIVQFATKGGLIELILKFDINQTRRKLGPNISSPNKRFTPIIRQHLTISNESSMASIRANLKTGFLEIEHTIFGLSRQVKKYILDPYESLIFLHAHNFLLSLDLSSIIPGPSALGCIHAMNKIVATATFVEREPQVVRL